jgi:hypothetical protein
MAGAAAVALLVLILEDDDLLALHVAQHFYEYLRTRDEWRADQRTLAASDQQDFAKLDLAAHLGVQQRELYYLPLFDAVLHPAVSDNRVHDAAPQYKGSGFRR